MANVQHENITDSADIHEPKQVAGASTSDAGKIITPNSSSNGVGVLRLLEFNELASTGADAGAVVEADGTGTATEVGPVYWEGDLSWNDTSDNSSSTRVKNLSYSFSADPDVFTFTFPVSGYYRVETSGDTTNPFSDFMYQSQGSTLDINGDPGSSNSGTIDTLIFRVAGTQ